MRTCKPEKKEADLAGPATTNDTETSYPESCGRASGFARIPDSVKDRWIVRRDASGQEYIVLNGGNSLARAGLDHAYMISGVCVAAWLTSRQIVAKVQKLKKAVAGLKIEQMGDTEAVVSVHVGRVDDLCRAVNARRRRTVSDKERQRLQRISPIARRQKVLAKSHLRTVERPQSGKGV